MDALTFRAMELRELVKACRKRARLTQKEFAARINVYRETIAYWESGTQIPTWDSISKILNVVDLKIEDCLTLPPDPAMQTEDEQVLRIIRDALSRGGDLRGRVLEQAWILEAHCRDERA